MKKESVDLLLSQVLLQQQEEAEENKDPNIKFCCGYVCL
jgi:hypothetical protein